MASRFFMLAIATVSVVAVFGNQAAAHDLQGRVTLLPDSIKVEAWFNDDTPAQEARVAIIFANGIEVTSGKTDDKGVCLLNKINPGRYKAIIELIGHRETIPFEVAETTGVLEISSSRMNKTLGLFIGISGLLGVSCLFWLTRQRKRSQVAATADASEVSELNRSHSVGPAADIPPSDHR